MGQIILPLERKINGPWILDLTALEELSEILEKIEEKIELAFETLLTIGAEQKLLEYSNSHNVQDLEEAKILFKKLTYNFGNSETFAEISTQQGSIIKEKNLISLLKGAEIKEYNPCALIVNIRKGPCQFTLEVTTKYRGELETRIKAVDEDLFNDINYELNKWIENHKPSFVKQKWFSWFPFASLPIIMILCFGTPLFIKSDVDAYKSQLEQKTNMILKDGLSSVETTEAMEIILQYQTGYVPEKFKQVNKIDSVIVIVWILTLVGLVILMIKPTTVIGLGKSTKKVKFYKWWTYTVLVYIPLAIIIPFILSKL